MQSGNHLENLIKHTIPWNYLFYIVGGQYLWILRQTLTNLYPYEI